MRNEYGRDDSNVTTKLTYLLIGGGIGAVIALLFAPKSGQELREDIADVTRKGIEKSKETAAQLQERAGEYYEVGRERANELYQTAQEKAGLTQAEQAEARSGRGDGRARGGRAGRRPAPARRAMARRPQQRQAQRRHRHRQRPGHSGPEPDLQPGCRFHRARCFDQSDHRCFHLDTD